MKKNYAKMNFGELMVTSSEEAAAIARGDLKPAKVSSAPYGGGSRGLVAPDGPTQRLLEVAERHPEAVLEHVSGRPGAEVRMPRRAAARTKRRWSV